MSAAEEVVATQIESSDKEPSLRETIEAATKEVQDRERDEQGRFVAKESKEEKANELQPRPSEKSSEAEPASKPNGTVAIAPNEGISRVQENGEKNQGESSGNTQPPPSESLAAPASWSYQAKQKWADLPQEIKSEISKRELDMTRGMTKMDDERQFARAMGQVVQPYQALIQSQGSNAPAYVGQLLNTVYTLQTGAPHVKAQLWQQLAQQFGIDNQQLAQQSQLDPNVAPIYQEVQQLKTQLQQQQEAQRQAQIAAQQQQEAQAIAMIEDFGRNPANKYFSAVKATMGALMQSGEARDLQEAYDMAINARPDIRAQLQAEEKAKREAEAERQQKVIKAKAKSSSVRGGPGGIQLPPVGERTLRQELEAAMAEAGGRV